MARPILLRPLTNLQVAELSEELMEQTSWTNGAGEDVIRAMHLLNDALGQLRQSKRHGRNAQGMLRLLTPDEAA